MKIHKILFSSLLISFLFANTTFASDDVIEFDRNCDTTMYNLETTNEDNNIIPSDILKDITLDGYIKEFDEETQMYNFILDNNKNEDLEVATLSDDNVIINGQISEFNDLENILQNDVTTGSALIFSNENLRASYPDLTVSINQGNFKQYAEKDMTLNFSISNIGSVGISKQSTVAIYGNNNLLGSFSINKLNANSKMNGSFTLNFGEYFGKANIKIVADVNNVIQESNENNNTSSVNYNVIYCTHYPYSTETKIENSSNIIIKVENAAKNTFGKDYFANVQEWNGITNNLFISKVVFSDDINTYYDISIKNDSHLASGTLGTTNYNFYEDSQIYVKSEILLNSNTLPQKTEEKKIKTLLHELGHGVGLAHPENDKRNVCQDYYALMRQSIDSFQSYTITMHDIYNLLGIYEKSQLN